MTIEYLRDCFEYNGVIGVLTWKKRPVEHFISRRAWRIFNARRAGKPVGSSTRLGYIRISIDTHDFYAHRIAWAIMTGAWPENKIDHIDGNPSNNAISNLREATSIQQAQNCGKRSNNKSGFMGVHWHKHARRWRSRIEYRGKHKHLGYFDTKEEAYQAYLTARKRLFAFQPVPRKGPSMAMRLEFPAARTVQ